MYHFVQSIYTSRTTLAAPLYLLDSRTGGGVDGLLKAATDDAELDESDKLLVCAHCGHVITSGEKRIERMGSHVHLFINPSGIQFEIGCFSQAPGCHYSGMATGEWTWFPGYRWRYAECENCHVHLGWQYLGGDGGGFYGLILARLVLIGDTH